ncbi:MAG: NHLP bacteriocin export ABC transporter permease/ATPase subunit [Oscillospiraceae bacterium]
MGWFDDQIKQRIQHDDEVFSDSFIHIAGAVMGKKLTAALNDSSVQARNSIEEIMKFYHIKSAEMPESLKTVDEQLEYRMRPHGIMRRTVSLNGEWYKDAMGAMLGTLKNGGTIALIPTGFSGYSYYDTEKGKRVRLNKKTAQLIDEEAICFYKPFPLRKITVKDMIAYMLKSLSVGDFALFAGAVLVVSLLGMLVPKLTNILLSDVIEISSSSLLMAIVLVLVCVTISTSIFTAVKNLYLSRINTKVGISVSAATMMRVVSLPAEFFKEYSAGDLANRVIQVNILCNMLVSSALSLGMSAIFSLIYIIQIFNYAPALVGPAVLIVAVTLLLTIICAAVQTSISYRKLDITTKEAGMSYSIISGIQKIKLAGAEKRIFARWAKLYAKEAELTYNPPMIIKVNKALISAVTLIGTVVLYFRAVTGGISVADYFAFNSAYGMLSGAFAAVAPVALLMADIKPILKMIQPIMDTVPEVSEGKRVVEKLSGSIELNHVSFRYNENSPMIIDDISLKITPGQYVAIVGTTGCGKSTLMRLLLGFEKPKKGAVYYDGKDLDTIDLKSLRRNVGTVMQNGTLFQGDIYSNITISAPWLSMDDAWEAAEQSGIADDIRRMPMQMHTLIAEGAGGISGGQKQRIMIARAIAPKPKVLMFDEATSALDNITQKTVSDSLDKLKCTRIVIAHRLSTIKHCDRILVLDKGKIIEDGNYDELIAKNGFFAELVARQRVDN